MNMISELRKIPDFSKQKSQICKVLGGNEEITRDLERIEKLKDSLVERYNQKKSQVTLVETTQMNVDETIPIETSTSQAETIDCKTLFKLMEGNQKLLIMDCRSEEDYEQSKMIYKYTMNIPEKILKLGMTASKIQEQLPNDSKVFWNLRLQRQLIFVDWFSKRLNRNSPVWHLKEILMEWDQDDDNKKPEIFLLSGGYEEWKTVYPMKCINPQYPSPKTSKSDMPVLEEIEYPNIEDIQMKDASLNKSIPHVDRSIKPNKTQPFDSPKTQLELLEEKEKIMNKSLLNEKELLNLETDYKQIVSNKENHDDSTSKEQQYIFKIWELQAKENDIQLEEKSIKELLGQTIEDIKEPQEITKVMQVEQNLREIENERKRVHEERERKKKEREEALKYARERKPQLDDVRSPPKTQRKNEIILSPKELSNQVNTTTVPTFDRSSKPTQNVPRQIFNEQDFSPVYGRVVSVFELDNRRILFYVRCDDSARNFFQY